MATESHEPSVRITLTQVYQKLVDIETRLGDHPKQLDDHESRIRNLEMRVWGFAGIGSALSIVVSLILSRV